LVPSRCDEKEGSKETEKGEKGRKNLQVDVERHKEKTVDRQDHHGQRHTKDEHIVGLWFGKNKFKKKNFSEK
jgi:hypothetical protein